MSSPSSPMESSSPESQPPSALEIGQDADSLLLVSDDEESYLFRISEAVICRVSRQLNVKSMPFSVVHSPNGVEFSWKTEDAAAALDFLNIIHERRDSLTGLNGERLARIARVAFEIGYIDAVSSYILDAVSEVVREVEAAAVNPGDARPISDLLDLKRVRWEDLMDIALFCRRNRLFWSTTRVAAMQANTELATPTKVRFNYRKLPTLRQGHSIYGENIAVQAVPGQILTFADRINTNRTQTTQYYIAEVYHCLGEEFERDGQYVAARIRYGAFVYEFMQQNIDPSAEIHYPGSLFNAIQLVEMVVASKDDDMLPKPLSGGYLARDIQADILAIKGPQAEEVAGICLGCLLSDDESVDFFTHVQCRKHPF